MSITINADLEYIKSRLNISDAKMEVYQNKTVDASINAQAITYDSGYTGLGIVTVNAYNIDSCYLLAASI